MSNVTFEPAVLVMDRTSYRAPRSPPAAPQLVVDLRRVHVTADSSYEEVTWYAERLRVSELPPATVIVSFALLIDVPIGSVVCVSNFSSLRRLYELSLLALVSVVVLPL